MATQFLRPSETTAEAMPAARDKREIYLSKPGGQKEGPYTLERINRDLAAKKYRDTDYWVWHEGLTGWAPLYTLPGVLAMGAAAPVVSSPVSPAHAPGPKEDRGPARENVSSGMPVSALEQIFAFTTGDGPAAWRSPKVTQMLEEITGEGLDTLRKVISRDVVGRCAVGDLLNQDGSISDAVWHVMSLRRPTLVQQARERLYRVCVRTFRIEADTIVALVLFYRKLEF